MSQQTFTNPGDEAIELAMQALQRAKYNSTLKAQMRISASQIRATGNKVITTGMGKAGFVAQKFAATMSSMGAPSVYIHPGEAAHGDLGMIQNGDVIVALSTSGKTLEVMHFLEQARAMQPLSVVVITSDGDSPVAKYGNAVVHLGAITEACPAGLTPTTSTTLMMSVCDQIALNVANLNGFTAHDFALRHHGGYLGEKARNQ